MHPHFSYRPFFKQATDALDGNLHEEPPADRDRRFAEAEAVGEQLLREFAARASGVAPADALPEMMACLMVACWKADAEADAAGRKVLPRGTFDAAVSRALMRLDLAAREPLPGPARPWGAATAGTDPSPNA